MTVRDLVRQAASDIRSGDLSPADATALLAQMTSLLGFVLEEIREADMAYNGVLVKLLDSEEKANRAEVRAKVTPEYARAREAKDTHIVLVELIRSLKAILRSQQEEMRLQK